MPDQSLWPIRSLRGEFCPWHLVVGAARLRSSRRFRPTRLCGPWISGLTCRRGSYRTPPANAFMSTLSRSSRPSTRSGRKGRTETWVRRRGRCRGMRLSEGARRLLFAEREPNPPRPRTSPRAVPRLALCARRCPRRRGCAGRGRGRRRGLPRGRRRRQRRAGPVAHAGALGDLRLARLPSLGSLAARLRARDRRRRRCRACGGRTPRRCRSWGGSGCAPVRDGSSLRPGARRAPESGARPHAGISRRIPALVLFEGRLTPARRRRRRLRFPHPAMRRRLTGSSRRRSRWTPHPRNRSWGRRSRRALAT